ncbi:MAG: hypothetical protein JSV91_08220 [Phycisphaerales bacterium]|nr:MAG: hypothetical protein JSV91_08220 [Phycisphaerales bacterium]
MNKLNATIAVAFAFGAVVVPARAAFVDFESLPLGSVLHVGDAWVESGVEIRGCSFFWYPSGWTGDGWAEIGNDGLAGGSGHEAGWINNINLDFDFGGPQTYVSFLFGEYGGNLNIEINGYFHNFENMGNIDATTIGGVAVAVTDYTGGYYGQGTGFVELTGTINMFRIGGQEFALDNVYAIPGPGSAMMLGLASLLCIRRRR